MNGTIIRFGRWGIKKDSYGEVLLLNFEALEEGNSLDVKHLDKRFAFRDVIFFVEGLKKKNIH